MSRVRAVSLILRKSFGKKTRGTQRDIATVRSQTDPLCPRFDRLESVGRASLHATPPLHTMAPLDHSVQGSLATHNSRLVQVARLRRLSRTFVAVRAKSRSGSISSTHGVCHSACLVIFVSTSKPFTNYIYHLICISLHYTTYIIMKIQTALVRNVYRVHSHVHRPARDRHDATYHLPHNVARISNRTTDLLWAALCQVQ